MKQETQELKAEMFMTLYAGRTSFNNFVAIKKLATGHDSTE